MAKLTVYNLEGKESGSINLDDKLFAVEINQDLIHQVITSLRNNSRIYTAHTKTRGERAGGGKKPWKQKGTGRARAGSIRSPIWRKGGVTFGPRNERNYTQKINKKMGAKAFLMALSGKIKDKELIILDSWKLKDGKAKEVSTAIDKLKLDKSILAVIAKSDEKFTKATKNISNFSTILAPNLNTLDILSYKYLVLDKEAVKALEERLTKKNG